jgi:hypothetical protein
VKVNAQGQFEGYAKATAPLVGDTLKLSLNAALEKVGQKALATSIAANASNGADGGSFVAIDPQNGQIYAMGSNPTYNPSSIANGISTKEWSYLNNPANHEPLLNRAIAGAFPDGSTFKPVTATAALETGVCTLPEQRRACQLRCRRPAAGDRGLRRRVLLQPRPAAQRQPGRVPQGLCAAGVGTPLRARPADRRGPPRREPRLDRLAAGADGAVEAGARVPERHRALQGGSQAPGRDGRFRQ